MIEKGFWFFLPVFLVLIGLFLGYMEAYRQKSIIFIIALLLICGSAGIDRTVRASFIGIPIPLDELKQHVIYEVVETLPQVHLVILKGEIGGKIEERIIKITPVLEKDFVKGEEIMKIDDSIKRVIHVKKALEMPPE